MDITKQLFKHKCMNVAKMLSYGFIQQGERYSFKKRLTGCDFLLEVQIYKNEITAVIMDLDFKEPYMLHLIDGAVGNFVGEVRSQYEEILEDIANKCFDFMPYQSNQTNDLIAYVKTVYGDELEFLWKSSTTGIWRRKNSRKWYGAVLSLPKRKLGIDSDEVVEIIDLRIQPEKMDALIDNHKYFPGWHMNKKNWYTIVLDGSISLEEIYSRLDESYQLANK